MKNEQQEIIARLDRIEKTIQGNKPKPLTLGEAAAYLGISKSYLYKLTSQARIPHYKPEGKKVYFEKSELDEWLLRNPVTTREAIGRKAADRLGSDWKWIGVGR